MMDFSGIARRAQQAISDNAPTILSAIGITGTVTTAVLAAKASYKAALRISDIDHELDKTEKIKQTWKLYIPAATTGALTVTSIAFATRMNAQRAAALAGALTLSQEGLTDYRKKVVEKLGDKKDQEIRDEIAEQRINKYPPSVIITTSENVWCHDTYSGRYFECGMETIRAAVNDINWQILNDDYATLTDFWEKIGLDPTSNSDSYGWNTDTKFEVGYSTVIYKGKPVIVVEFLTQPVTHPHKF